MAQERVGKIVPTNSHGEREREREGVRVLDGLSRFWFVERGD